MANPLNTTGILMPDDFDHSSYDAIWEHIRPKSHQYPDARSQFVAAWNGISYRFRACAHHSNAFTKAIESEHDYENRYIQERELLNFFVNGLAVFESFYFAMFAVGAMLRSDKFPLQGEKDKKNVKPKMTVQKFRTNFPNDKMTKRMENLVGSKKDTNPSSKKFAEWSDIRNLLAHRQSPPRTHFLNANTGIQYQPPILTGIELAGKESLKIDQNTTLSRRIWLSKRLKILLLETNKFVEDNFR